MRSVYIFITGLIVFSVISCNGRQNYALYHTVDTFNDKAYHSHYKNVDSVRVWAHKALELASEAEYKDGRNEALNNIAFERFQQMDFDSALCISQEVIVNTDEDVERLVADVMQMKVAQRTSDNLSFFKYRTDALKCIRKLDKRAARMSKREQHRYYYGRSDFHIASSTYFYYLDQTDRALEEIRAAEPYSTLNTDTAQWLYYCYMRGSGGLADNSDEKAIAREELGYLLKCFWLARYEGYLFFLGNAEQSLATLFADSARQVAALEAHPETLPLLTSIFEGDNLPLALAQSALSDFVEYDDLYQEACAQRTLGELAFASGDYQEALRCYSAALDCVNFHHQCYYESDELIGANSNSDLLVPYDSTPGLISVEREWVSSPKIKTVPEWISGIRQQLSLAYSALDQKAASDYNRNIFLDLLDVTREDAELESRVAELTAQKQYLHKLILIVSIVACLTALLVFYLLRNWRKRSEAQRRLLRQKMQHIQETAQVEKQMMADEQEHLQEEKKATELRLLKDKQQNIEKRAKLQLVMAIMPFLDRIIHEVNKMRELNCVQQESLIYIKELTEHIIQLNDLLTDWIKMQQGQINLAVTSFELEPLFASIRRGHYAFDQKKLQLNVEKTHLCVKADRALTLFMLNTLADNARKFTPKGGSVSIKAKEGSINDCPYVELSVEDTGYGISEQDAQLILNNKVYDAKKIGESTDVESQTRNKGFGFGLMNCKGIIEKYRKTSQLFNVCQFGIDSKVGEGSRFWFRLPRVVPIFFIFFFSVLACTQATKSSHSSIMGDGNTNVNNKATSINKSSFPQEAYRFADSVYFCNLDYRFEDALMYADSALAVMGTGNDTLDYSLVLGISNEQAVAALAVHDWSLYKVSNDKYKQLYKLLNRDEFLDTYCVLLERSQKTSQWALITIIALCIIAASSTYLFYFLPYARFVKSVTRLNDLRLQHLQQQNDLEHQRQKDDIEVVEDEHRKRLYEENRLHVQNLIIDNCLSTIKHETMYYPGRINQLVERLEEDENQIDHLLTLSETVAYYKEIYVILSAQALQQSEALNFRRRNIDFEDLITPVQQRFQKIALRKGFNIKLLTQNNLKSKHIRGDNDLLTMLINSLLDEELNFMLTQHDVDDEKKSITISAREDNDFAKIEIVNPNIEMSDVELQSLFSPHHNGIPFLIARQIIREHDSLMGHPGCRINAEKEDAGHKIWFTIPLQRELQEK